ncbi:MAG: conjugal transfer protein TraG N-terminal domain-containing protein [Deltaproteobacteria bacterium]|nr:conjugal transfer protein TraG N-terminal domain-containing protein [Deltaproteobacteria bacterium]
MDIWCIGDLNYFVSVLNGLAMLSNIGLFNELIKLGLILAVLVLGFQAIFQTGGAGGLPWGKFILAFIAFKFLFGSVTTVHVHDTYTLQSRSVDNVPYGVAVTGSILSKVAHEITENLEQAFSLPHMTTNGFAGPLEVLTKGQKFITGLDTLHNGKITKTLVEYCDKCTSAGINKGELDLSKIKVASDPWNAMKWNSDIYYAMTWLPSDPPEGTLRTCTEAWEAIDNYLRGQLWSDWNNFLSSQICNEGAGSCDPVLTVQNALDDLADAGQDARNYMLAAVLLPAFEQGQIEFNSFLGKPEMSIIVGQAREQRNIQWQAEGSLFMNVARPMMAFFEGFLYAITPFMALLVAFVPSGLGLVTKYLMMFLWVQLWMPIMAILNHFAQMVAQEKLICLIDGSIPLTSLQGHLMGASAINDWLGTVGILVASTPAISLALLFGGAITMTHLAGRLQHGDFVNEKISAPDVVQPGAAMLMSPATQWDPTRGVYKTGASPMAGEITIGDDYRSIMTSAQQLSQTTGLAFGESLRQTISSGRVGSSGLSSGVMTHDTRTSSITTGEALTHAFAQKLAHAHQMNAAQTQALEGMLTAGGGLQASGGIKLLGNGLKVTGQGQAQLRQTFGDKLGMSLAKDIEDAASISGKHDFQAVMQDALAYDASRGEMASYLDQYDSKKVQDTQEAGKRHYDAQQEYIEAAQKARYVGGNARMDTIQAGNLLTAKHGSGGRDYAFRELGHLDVMKGGQFEEQVKWAQTALGVTDKETAQWVGLLRRLDQMGREGDVGASKALTHLREEAFGYPHIDLGDPQRHQGIVPSGIMAEGDRIEQGGRGLTPLSSSQISGRLDSQKDSLTGHWGRDDVERHHYDQAMAIRNQAVAQQKEQMLNRYEQVLQDQQGKFVDSKTYAQAMTNSMAGAISYLESLGKTGWHTGATVLEGLKGLLKDMTRREGPVFTWKDAAQAWNDSRQGYFQAMKAEAESKGLSGPQAEVYAQSKANALGAYIGQKYQIETGALGFGSTLESEEKALKERTDFFQSYFGASPERAQQLAQMELDRVKDAGMTGGINYAAPVGQINSQVEALKQYNLQAAGQVLGMESALQKYEPIIQAKAAKYGVDVDLIRSVIKAESNGNPNAKSDKGCIGLMQLASDTAKDMGVTNRWDPEQNIDGGTRYLAQQMERYAGDPEQLPKALAAYNAGPGKVGHGPLKETEAWTYAETRGYVNTVMDDYQRLKDMEYQQLASLEKDELPERRAEDLPYISIYANKSEMLDKLSEDNVRRIKLPPMQQQAGIQPAGTESFEKAGLIQDSSGRILANQQIPKPSFLGYIPGAIVEKPAQAFSPGQAHAAEGPTEGATDSN